MWAVDNEGGAFHRIGVKAPNDHSLNAAWLPIDNGDTVFTQIIAGPQDWMVSYSTLFTFIRMLRSVTYYIGLNKQIKQKTTTYL